MINEYNTFEGFSELSLAALANDDMLAFFRENRFNFKNDKGKREEESLYNIEEYIKIRDDFVQWVEQTKCIEP